jgi:hypothetical protein
MNIPTPSDKDIFIDAAITCSDCKKKVEGKIRLSYKELRVLDSKGFTIMFDEILCDDCVRKNEHWNPNESIEGMSAKEMEEAVYKMINKYVGKVGHE